MHGMESGSGVEAASTAVLAVPRPASSGWVPWPLAAAAALEGSCAAAAGAAAAAAAVDVVADEALVGVDDAAEEPAIACWWIDGLAWLNGCMYACG